MGAVLELAASNPLSFPALLRTIAFQVGIIGSGTLALSVKGVPFLNGLESRALLNPVRVRKILLLMFSYTWKGVAFIFLTGTLGVLLTDVGWIQTLKDGFQWTDFLMARASGAPNGAHLLSYIPLPLLGLYVAIKFRKDVLLDCYQGIMLVGFGVAFHELPWLVAYLVRYYGELGLFLGSNFTEDFFFGVMCVMLIIAWWKFPSRSIPLKAFRWPLVIYSVFLAGWFAWGLPVTTINNFQIGKGPFEITQWWADPWVNGVEILSWVLVAAMFWVVAWKSKPSS